MDAELDSLRRNHLAEVLQLSITVGQATGLPGTISMLCQYGKYLISTWSSVFKAIMSLGFRPVQVATCLSFAFGASVVMGVLLVACIIGNYPNTVKAFNWFSEKYYSGLSPVNAPRNIFREISREEVDAARVALQQPPKDPKAVGEHIFNLDMAKLLLQLASLMYERGAEPVNSAVATAHTHGISPSSTTSGTQYSFTRGGALTAVNDELQKKDGAIADFCHTFGLNYAPVSELNTRDSAYAALFWDPSSNWIILAFKGTSPTEYNDWVTDFDYQTVDADLELPGFGKVHGGFFQRLFRSHNSMTKPWDTIVKGVNELTKDILKRNPDSVAKINLYVTGHSLGSAIASLAFSRLTLVKSELDGHIVLRDGYMFAAPIVCDAKSVKAFNKAINMSMSIPRTLWRITNMDDIVATGLPAFGDLRNNPFSTSSCPLLSFAHLGAEIKMLRNPTPCLVVGWPLCSRNDPVVVTSTLHSASNPGDHGRSSDVLLILEQNPFFGRILQHAGFSYWDQLQSAERGA